MAAAAHAAEAAAHGGHGGGLPHIQLLEIYGVPGFMVMSFLVLLILFVCGLLTRRSLKLVPDGLQNFFEFVYCFWYDMGESLMGKKVQFFMPLFLFLFLYILFGNLIGLVPGFNSPTASLNTTFALSLIVFFSTHIFGIRTKGLVGYLRHFWAGVPWWLKPGMFVIELISEFVRPISLAARLFGNIVAKEIMLTVLIALLLTFIGADSLVSNALAVFPLVLRPLIIVLGTLVSLIQACVFTILAMIYIAGAVSEGHDH